MNVAYAVCKTIPDIQKHNSCLEGGCQNCTGQHIFVSRFRWNSRPKSGFNLWQNK